MKLNISYNEGDIKVLNELYKKYQDTEEVKWRKKVLQNHIKLTKENIWKQIITCLITTQQRSGKNSRVSKFIEKEPFPLSYKFCKNQENLKQCVSDMISNHGLRFSDRISDYLTYNLSKLEEDNWRTITILLEQIVKEKGNNRKLTEREVARKISKMYKGFGPKQSRHLLIGLGLAQYEIPIDSRIIKWINGRLEEGTIPTLGLSDEKFYSFVLDQIQKLCNDADLLPAIVDALLFVDADYNR